MAIQESAGVIPGLPRFARNDGVILVQLTRVLFRTIRVYEHFPPQNPATRTPISSASAPITALIAAA